MSNLPDQLDQQTDNQEANDWFNLVMRCPACLADGKEAGPVDQWYHVMDNGMVQVGSSAEYRCLSCQHTEHVRNWRYACRAHQTEYRPTTAAHLSNALSTAGQITSIAGRQSMQKFLENLGEW
jgi:lipopolysaccharide biosynthesis regulator YciM